MSSPWGRDRAGTRADGSDNHRGQREATDRPEGGPVMQFGPLSAYGEPTGQAGAVDVSESVQWIRPWMAGLMRPPGWATM